MGLCTEEHIDTIESPTGRYSVDIVAKDCIGSSEVQEVLLSRTEGAFRSRTAVAVFDASDPERPADLSVRWRGDRRIVISANGARIWSFQPNWKDVRVMER